MQRVIIAILVLVVIAAGAAFYFMRPKPVAVEPPLPPEDFIKASAFLAPGAQAKLPTTVRVEVWIREDLLPVKSAEIDPDGDRGPLPTRALDVAQLKSVGGAPGTFYFDLPWDGPESGQASIGVSTARGNYSTTLYVNIASMQEWKEK